MNTPESKLSEAIGRQRDSLQEMLMESLGRIARACVPVWGDRDGLDEALGKALLQLPYCKYLYVLNTDAVQISDNISRDGLITSDYGRDRSQRPYIRETVPSGDFLLSDAYISLRAKRPSITAIQLVRNDAGTVLGYLGADYDLRDLPLTRELYEEPREWRQMKGDPSIRSSVFHQSRVESQMDRQMDTVLSVVEELMVDHGVYHVILHFSSGRAIIWLYDDPYRYRILDIEALTDPDTCLAYPCGPYPKDALVGADQIRRVLELFRALRFMDETLYLRSGTLNIFNGIVGLTFSCDGSHYIPVDEFLTMDPGFWMGAA
jgi:hypothetical protein